MNKPVLHLSAMHLLIGLLFLPVSCVSGVSKIVEGARVVEYEGFTASRPAEVRPLFGEGSSREFVGAVAIHDVGNGGALLQMMAGENCFVWLDLSTGESKSIVSRGRGPEEMVDAGFAGYRVNDIGDTELIAYSLSTFEAVRINLTRTLSEGKTVVLSRDKLPQMTMYALSNGSDIFCYSFGSDQTVGWNIIGEDGETVSLRPFGKYGRVGDPSKYFAATSVSEDGDKIVMGMASFPRQFILDRHGDDIAISLDGETDGSILDRLTPEGADAGDCCLWTQTSEDLVYCLILDQDAIRAGNMEELLLVFDWNGELKSATRIPEDLTSFIVSDEGCSITGITMNGLIVKVTL